MSMIKLEDLRKAICVDDIQNDCANSSVVMLTSCSSSCDD